MGTAELFDYRERERKSAPLTLDSLERAVVVDAAAAATTAPANIIEIPVQGDRLYCSVQLFPCTGFCNIKKVNKGSIACNTNE